MECESYENYSVRKREKRDQIDKLDKNHESVTPVRDGGELILDTFDQTYTETGLYCEYKEEEKKLTK